ncbi:LysR family transcriptional regulator [Plastoroseomonas arctica]|uniref:LysR family transcriptional regulator n=1 Tax=Plastoroseomonas arctica TaxID=1509237 RepID=A0AAF1K3E3_9PROT|nr:LysR family transcriptional regulator [Plastoroseomonas arctica]MBR0655524.1 LysR family transcriptional regulator [Plastoroseomonas arctica]
MNTIHSAALDLNLLKIFDAVMQTRSVSRAAALLGVGQSAVSHGLARLREVTRDPLFVRTGGRMEPTVRAQRIAEPMREALMLATRVLSPDVAEPFDPGLGRTVFTIGAGDYAASVLLTALLAEIASSGWDIGLSVCPLDRRTASDLLDAGEIDMALGLLPKVQPWQERQVLFEESHACLFDGAQLGLAPPIERADFARLPHIVPSLHGEFTSFVDGALETDGLGRRCIMATAHFLSIPLMLKTVPAIATLPIRLSVACANAAALTVSPLPFAGPRFDVSMLWHKRDSASAAHQWLRHRIATHNPPEQSRSKQ